MVPLVMWIVSILDPFLAKCGVDPAVLRGARPYLHTLNWSTPPLLLYFCLRRYLQAKHIVRPVMWALVTANLVNLAGNCVLVFGHWAPPDWERCGGRAILARRCCATLPVIG